METRAPPRGQMCRECAPKPLNKKGMDEWSSYGIFGSAGWTLKGREVHQQAPKKTPKGREVHQQAPGKTPKGREVHYHASRRTSSISFDGGSEWFLPMAIYDAETEMERVKKHQRWLEAQRRLVDREIPTLTSDNSERVVV
eukprot:1998379-Rhodomonas_salina.1